MKRASCAGTAAFLAVVLLAIALVYLPGLAGPYVFDDEPNITLNDGIAITTLDWADLQGALLANDSGPLRRPLASLSFALNHYFAGSFESSIPFKATNLVIHLINVLLVYWLASRLVRALPVAKAEPPAIDTRTGLICATLWGLHPINVSTVLYVVQRMTSLSALFVLTGLLLFVHGRFKYQNNERFALAYMYAGVVGGTILGLAAKETAALLPLFALAIELTLFRRKEPFPAPLKTFYFILLIPPLVAALVYVAIHPGFISDTYAARPFTPIERLLTESRVLWHYARLIAVPNAREFGLFHDDITISKSILDPTTTLLAVAGIVALIVISARLRERAPLLAFAVSWFLIGHLLESSIIGLEIAFEHRNYLPAIGPVLAASYVIARYSRSPSREHRIAGNGSVAAFLLLLGFVTHITVSKWQSLDVLAAESVRSHPDSARANDLASNVNLNKGDLTSAEYYAMRSAALAPREAGFAVNLYTIAALVDAAHARHAIELAPCRLGSTTTACPISSSASIEDRLRNGALSAITLGSLVNLRICLAGNFAGCEVLGPTAQSWYAAANQNRDASMKVQETLAFNAALVAGYSGNYTRGVTYLEKAATLAPDKLIYRVGEVEFLTRSGRRDEALRVLSAIEHDARYSERSRRLNAIAIQRLREALGQPA